jgi:hypothetical protein
MLASSVCCHACGQDRWCSLRLSALGPPAVIIRISNGRTRVLAAGLQECLLVVAGDREDRTQLTTRAAVTRFVMPASRTLAGARSAPSSGESVAKRWIGGSLRQHAGDDGAPCSRQKRMRCLWFVGTKRWRSRCSLDGEGAAIMSRLVVPKISLEAVERKRVELNSQRALLQRALRDSPSIEDALQVFRALQAMLHPPRKNADPK